MNSLNLHGVAVIASEMLRGEVQTEAIWSMNLNLLDDVTGWNLTENEESGLFTIEPASTV